MKRDDFDLLDKPTPPLPEVFRLCGAPGCRRHARTSGRYCSTCHAAAVRRWRDGDRAAINERRREAAAKRTELRRARDVARATLAMAIKRGKIERRPCAVCAARNVTAYQYDPARPLDVTWVCRAHRAAWIDDAEQLHRQATEQEAWDGRVGGAITSCRFFRSSYRRRSGTPRRTDRRASDCRRKRRSTRSRLSQYSSVLPGAGLTYPLRYGCRFN